MGRISIIFVVVLIADLSLIWVESPWRWASKTLLVPALLLGYFLARKKHWQKSDTLFSVGLFFAWGGDLLLLRDDLFLAGLGSFLVMQILFSIHFWTDRDRWTLRSAIALVFLLSITFSMVFLLWPHLGSLQIPVLGYCLAISTMCFLAWQRLQVLNGYTLVAVGAFLFVISDSVIAIHRFTDIHLGKLTIMLTYGLALWGITEGIIRRQKIDTP